MSKPKTTSKPNPTARKRMSEEDFFRKYSREMWGDVEPAEFNQRMSGSSKSIAHLTDPRLVSRILPPFLSFPLFPVQVGRPQQKTWWLLRMLKAASRENSPQAYQGMLEFWLTRIGAPVPLGVFKPLPSSGRPVKGESIAAHREWISAGKPPLDGGEFCDQVAMKLYPVEFARSKPRSKKRNYLRQRVRQAIRREDLRATKLES